MSETAVVQNPKLNSVRQLLTSMKQQFEMALPKHLSAERMMRVALTACQRNPKLLDCTPKSFAGAMMTAAQVGLEPDGTLGRAYLIPRKNNRNGGALECNFQVGYLGLLDLCQRSGDIASVRADVVRKGDQLSYSKGLDEKLEHHEGIDNFEADVTHVYAIIRTKSGGAYWDIWPAAKVEAHRRRFSKDSRDDSAWSTDWVSMAKKTLLTAVAKLAPKSIEVATAVVAEERAEAGLPIEIETVDVTTGEVDAPAKSIADLKAKAKKEKSQQEQPEVASTATLPAAEPATPPAAPVSRASAAGHPSETLFNLVRSYKGMLGDHFFADLLKKHGGNEEMPNYGLGQDALKGLLDACNKAVGS